MTSYRIGHSAVCVGLSGLLNLPAEWYTTSSSSCKPSDNDMKKGLSVFGTGGSHYYKVGHFPEGGPVV